MYINSAFVRPYFMRAQSGCYLSSQMVEESGQLAMLVSLFFNLLILEARSKWKL
jgi:hypothetical protein